MFNRKVLFIKIKGRETGNIIFNKLNLGFGETKRYYSDAKFTQSIDLVEIDQNNKLTIFNKLKDLRNWSEANPDKPIDRKLYPFLLNPGLLELAYKRLKSNPGNLTQGIIPTTLDGLSYEWIVKTIDELKSEEFKFHPGRRIQIPKANGGGRPLNIAPPRDKLVQECIRIILEAIFEPNFSDNSHGFRFNRSCHTALKHVKQKFHVCSWFIEGDISKCFDKIDHKILMKILEDKIKDRRFTNLIRKAINAGYFEFREYRHSIIGTPQGSVISPILCNIYLDKLDQFVNKLSINFNKGDRVKTNPKYTRLRYLRNKTDNSLLEKNYFKEMQKLPYFDPFDPNFRRLVYVRYADDWLVGIRGSLEEAEECKNKITTFLENELKLTLNQEKTVITHIYKDKALFLGVLIGRAKHRRYNRLSLGQPIRNKLDLRFEAPISRITKKLIESGFRKDNVPVPRFLWLSNNKDQIIHLYNSVLRGYLNYYSFVHNYAKMAAWTYYNLKTSCAKLLAAKLNLGSQNKVYKKFGKDLKGLNKPYGISFMKIDYKIKPWKFNINQKDYIKSLYTESISIASLRNLNCSVCGSSYRIEMHHVLKWKILCNHPKSKLVDKLMVKRKRKQIPLCRDCHMKHHYKSNFKT